MNILVLDTEVYSNTGGQASKATPRGAVAKFAAAGKSSGKKDLGAIARSYGNVYVAQIAIGSNDLQATKAMVEAEAWPGPSLVIAYSTCIAHGIEMSTSMSHQKDAVRSGYWPLYRFSPSAAEDGTPFQLDSKAPTIPVSEFVASEARFAILARTNPERAAELGALLQGDADERWRYYSQLATVRRSLPHTVEAVPPDPSDAAQPVLTPATAAETSDDAVTDLTTKYLGLTLRTPIVASAGPLTREVDLIRRLVDSGASAIVLPSLFEEEILLEERQLDRGGRGRHEPLRRGARLLPQRALRRLREPARPLPRSSRGRAGRGRRARDREHQRHLRGRVDELRPAARRRRGRRRSS